MADGAMLERSRCASALTDAASSLPGFRPTWTGAGSDIGLSCCDRRSCGAAGGNVGAGAAGEPEPGAAGQNHQAAAASASKPGNNQGQRNGGASR
jgi:hypothetical protein